MNLKKLFSKNSIKKEILNFFTYRNLLKLLKNNIKLRKEFFIDNSQIDKIFSYHKEIENESLIINIINNFKNIIFLIINESKIKIKNKEIKIISKNTIFNPNETEMIINGKRIKFITNFIPKKGFNKILIATNSNLPKNLSKMFFNLHYIVTIDFIKFESFNITKMNRMFQGCKNLKNLKFSIFKTNNVNSMEKMFCKCKNFKNLDLSIFNTNNLKNMKYMFAYCNNLSIINLSSFNTKNVLSMENMFDECYELTSLNL